MDEIHIHNVLDLLSLAREPDAVMAVMREAARILRPGGTIYAGHTISPGALKHGELEKLAAAHGLEMNLLVTPKWDGDYSEVDMKLIGEHVGGWDVGRLVPNSYLAALTKKPVH